MSYEYTYLSDQEKVDIITNHIRSYEYNLYNAELSKIEEESSPSSDRTKVASFDVQILEIQSKISVLEAEKSKFSI